MTITKKGIEFKISFSGKDIKITGLENVTGAGTMKIENMNTKGSRFDNGTLVINGKEMNGFAFSEDQIDAIKKESLRITQEIKSFLNGNDFLVECYQYNLYSIVSERTEELKRLNEEEYIKLSKEFINTNKELLVEVSRTKKAFEDTVIIYEIKEEMIVEVKEIIRDLTVKEATIYNVNDVIEVEGQLLKVSTSSRKYNDIDYGIIDKNFKVFVIKTNRRIFKKNY